jgi:CBS domain containing-hemolysin-like protein
MNMIEHGCGSKGCGSWSRAGARWRLPLAVALASIFAALLPVAAEAAHNPETIDKIADVLTIVVLIIVPVVGIAVFWMLHVLPEKIAEKRHHPQTQAIQTLCLLSLVFGGLLWPIAWLWAFTKPVLYKMAYGTDKVDPHAAEAPEERAKAEGKGAA